MRCAPARPLPKRQHIAQTMLCGIFALLPCQRPCAEVHVSLAYPPPRLRAQVWSAHRSILVKADKCGSRDGILYLAGRFV
jgi:hypothetical protein